MNTVRKIQPMPFHQYLANQIAISGKTQREIAAEIGYGKPNIITMFKQGLTKVPINKIKPLAISIGADPVKVLRMAMGEYMPEVLDSIEDIIGLAVSSNEKEIIQELRKATGDSDPRMTTESKKALVVFTKSLEK